MNKLSEEDLIEIKDIVADKDIIDDEELLEIKSLKKQTSTNIVSIGLLYSKCYNILSFTCFLFKNDDKDFSNMFIEKLKELYIEDLILLVDEYQKGESYGDYLIEQRMKTIINNNRLKCLELINLFQKVIGDLE